MGAGKSTELTEFAKLLLEKCKQNCKATTIMFYRCFFRLYQIVKFKITKMTFYVITFKILAF